MTHRPILIVEDEENIANLIATYLENAGFTTRHAADGRHALQRVRNDGPRLVILDLLLPEIDGWTVAQTLRRESDVPFLILSAQRDEIDRVAGLSAGADDYVVKPFSPRELVERVRAILRRYEGEQASARSPRQRVADVELDADRHRVTRDGTPVELTAVEFRLLEALMAARGRVQSREALLARVYPDEPPVIDRVVDIHISKLRRKLGDDANEPRLIETIRGFGYRLQDPTEDA